MSFSTLASNNLNNNVYSSLNENTMRDHTYFLQQNSDDFNQINFNYQNSSSLTFSNGNGSLSNIQNQYARDFQQEIEDYQERSNNESQEDFNIKGDDISEMSEIMDERQFIRVSTAPPRPLTDLEEFKRSYDFLLLEQAIVVSSKLIQKDYQKFDLDSPEGQKIFRKYLNIIEKLIKQFSCQTACRAYREKFSKAYKILYKNGELCYLTEILDSAQEGFPYLYVNGEKYIFSQEVLESGQNLLNSFFKMSHIMRNAYTRTCQENLNMSSYAIKKEIASSLEKFDICWAKFEQLYVMELMVIETEARRYVQCAIEIEKELTSFEIREKIKGRIFISSQSQEYTNLRKTLCKYIAQMNAVANMEGKGRDDLDIEILIQAEGILRKVTNEQSRAVRVLAEEIKNNFQNLRALFRKYEQNIEMVDPQLKNNHDLVQALNTYESSWEKGKNYFLDGKKCNYLIHFSHIIETTANKYKEFQESVDCRDADIFLTIPCLLILKLLDREDKNICSYFLPQMFDEKNKLNQTYKNLEQEFAEWKEFKKKSYSYYNTLERIILNIDQLSEEEAHIPQINSNGKSVSLGHIVHKIKSLAMELQRNNPMEWNSFLDVALCS
ncbi:hypothetical protein ABPG74_005990 [Tetrahymena malaccensis]